MRDFQLSPDSSTSISTGPGCSKLTASLVNVSLTFQTLISEIRHYFCRKNVRSFCIAKASPFSQQEYECIW